MSTESNPEKLLLDVTNGTHTDVLTHKLVAAWKATRNFKDVFLRLNEILDSHPDLYHIAGKVLDAFEESGVFAHLENQDKIRAALPLMLSYSHRGMMPSADISRLVLDENADRQTRNKWMLYRSLLALNNLDLFATMKYLHPVLPEALMTMDFNDFSVHIAGHYYQTLAYAGEYADARKGLAALESRYQFNNDGFTRYRCYLAAIECDRGDMERAWLMLQKDSSIDDCLRMAQKNKYFLATMLKLECLHSRMDGKYREKLLGITKASVRSFDFPALLISFWGWMLSCNAGMPENGLLEYVKKCVAPVDGECLMMKLIKACFAKQVERETKTALSELYSLDEICALKNVEEWCRITAHKNSSYPEFNPLTFMMW